MSDRQTSTQLTTTANNSRLLERDSNNQSKYKLANSRMSSKAQHKVTDLHSIYQESNRLTHDMSMRSIENTLKNLNSPSAHSQMNKMLVLNQSSTQNIDIMQTNQPQAF